jgi:DNA polymerase-3 subunit beta
MKVTISKHDLVSLIGKIQSVVSVKPSLPILGNVLIRALDGQLIITATDLTVNICAYSEAKVHQAGAITLPARRLFQLIRELTTPQIEIECPNPEIAHLISGSSFFKVHGMHYGEFPSIPDLATAVTISLSTTYLKEMLSRTVFAALRDDNRQTLSGVLLQHDRETVTFTGTDGKRLARIRTKIANHLPDQGSYVIPLKAVEEMIKTLDGEGEECKITLTKDKLGLESGSVSLVTKLLSGQYPDVTHVIPEKKGSSTALHREELISLVRQVALFTSDTSNSVRFSFRTGVLELSAMSGEIGEGKVSMAANYDGPELDIAFNPVHCLDALRHSRDEVVYFDITGSYLPAVVTDSTEALFVIMPMRIEMQPHDPPNTTT